MKKEKFGLDSESFCLIDNEEVPNLDPVLNAIGQNDWNELRRLSLKAGGFGEHRKVAWPYLLHAPRATPGTSTTNAVPSEHQPQFRRRRRKSLQNDVSKQEQDVDEQSDCESCAPHPDERQIKLDTDRSFVIYPVEDMNKREKLQNELNHLIVSIFRNHPKLSYFQGYHDIITVLFLTLPEEDQLLCAEKFSLHRLRDSMGHGLEPLVGLLRIMKQLLRLSDPPLAALLERNTRLPYFALSNLLTLFSHDVPTLPLIQHVFDFLLSRPPIMTIYLAVAVVLTRKEEALKLEEEGEEGMLHSLMSSFPELADERAVDPEPIQSDSLVAEEQEAKDSDIHLKDEHTSAIEIAALSKELEIEKLKVEPEHEPLLPTKQPSSPIASHSVVDDQTGEGLDVPFSSKQELPISSPPNSSPPSSELVDGQPDNSNPTDSALLSREEEAYCIPPSYELGDTPSDSPSHTELTTLVASSSPDHDASPSLARDSVPTTPSRAPSPPMARRRARRPHVLLTDLLTRADALYALYPPKHPSLAVASIMGPKSVIFTWSEDANAMMDDETAENMVGNTELIVLPHVDSENEHDDAEDEDENEKEKESSKKARKKLKKRRPFPFEKRTAVAGAVLVLGVALAVYGVRASGPYSAKTLLGKAKGGHGHEREWKDLRKAGRWAGGVLLGASERVLGLAGW